MKSTIRLKSSRSCDFEGMAQWCDSTFRTLIQIVHANSHCARSRAARKETEELLKNQESHAKTQGRKELRSTVCPPSKSKPLCGFATLRDTHWLRLRQCYTRKRYDSPSRIVRVVIVDWLRVRGAPLQRFQRGIDAV